MMQGAFRLGTVRGIAVGLHFSWLLAAVLVTWSLAQGYFPAMYPGWAGPTYYVTGVIAACLLFFAVLLHEFGHALTAQRYGVPVRSIVLFVFGGVATLEREADNPRAEFWIAVMGPVVSAVLAGACFLLRPAARILGEPAEAIVSYLALVNGLLLLFNLVPGFPLDGGRILRAILWAVTGSQRRATTIAAAVGQAFAFGLIIWGVSRIIGGDLFGGIWTAFIGWFLNNAATEARRAAPLAESLAGITVAQIARTDPPRVLSTSTVASLVHDRMLIAGERTHLVYDAAGHLVGLITQTDVMRRRQEDWPNLAVAAVMTPARALKTVGPKTPLAEALQLLAVDDFHQLPVLAEGQQAGLLTRASLVRFLQLRAQLGGGSVPGQQDWPTNPRKRQAAEAT